MPDLALASIAFNKPRLVAEQIRLLDKYLQDDYRLVVFDASDDWKEGHAIEDICLDADRCAYQELTSALHDEGLNYAAQYLPATDPPYVGFLDHDVFPTRPTTLIDKIEPVGFYGVGQRHAPTGHLYLWPGFCFFSREWLNGRPLDFSGIRGDVPADNGDTGSNLWPLFENEDWSQLYRPEHGYRAIREPDDRGLQSWGYETIDSWIHFSNGSGWMDVENFEERERLLFEILADL